MSGQKGFSSSQLQGTVHHSKKIPAADLVTLHSDLGNREGGCPLASGQRIFSLLSAVCPGKGPAYSDSDFSSLSHRHTRGCICLMIIDSVFYH